MNSAFRIPHSTFAWLIFTASCLQAQSPLQPVAAPLTPAARLQQLDATYETNLRKLHAPLLNDYARELEVLKQSLTSKSRDADAKFVDAEIARVRALAATTGILPTDAPKKPEPPPAPAADGTPPKHARLGVPGLKKMSADSVVLNAADAIQSAQSPVVMRDKPGKALQLGRASWKIPSIAAGTYDLVLIYASADIPKEHSIAASINGTNLTQPLTPAQTTGSDENFRLARIGQVTFEKDTTDATLTLHVEPFDAAILWLRSVALSKPKPKAKPRTSP